MKKGIRMPYLGEFEQLVLLAVLRLGDDAYAVPIRQMIEQATARKISRGALYTTLDRLEQKGLLSSRGGETTEDRGGRPRRYHAVTPNGLRALRASHQAITRLASGLDTILGRNR
jgi:DNA-binding PadR family transcriptional regulator